MRAFLSERLKTGMDHCSCRVLCGIPALWAATESIAASTVLRHHFRPLPPVLGNRHLTGRHRETSGAIDVCFSGALWRRAVA
jgi:hypothetical protein